VGAKVCPLVQVWLVQRVGVVEEGVVGKGIGGLSSLKMGVINSAEGWLVGKYLLYRVRG
jgi:hypothetical protein